MPLDGPPPESLWAVVGASLAALIVKVPEWTAAYRKQHQRESSSVAVAKIEDRADQRLGLYNEVNKLWERLDKQQVQMDLMQAGRNALANENAQLREENRNLRLLLVRVIADVRKLRRQLGLTDDLDYDLPPEANLTHQ